MVPRARIGLDSTTPAKSASYLKSSNSAWNADIVLAFRVTDAKPNPVFPSAMI